MNSKTWFLLVVALVCGFGAAFCVKSLFFGDRASATNVVDAERDAAPKISTLVANVPLTSGEKLTAQNVRLALIPEIDVPRDAIFTFGGVAGRKVLRDIPVGTSISLYDLEMQEETQATTSYIPPGFAVVPIEIQRATNVKGGRNYLKTTPLDRIIKPGDVVDLAVVKEEVAAVSDDVLATRSLRLSTKTILEDVDVFAVVDESRFVEDAGEARRTSVVSVLLSAEQLKIVQKASEEGKVKILLRDADDSLNVESDSFDLSSALFSNDAASQVKLPVSTVVAEETEIDAETFAPSMNLDFNAPALADLEEPAADDDSSSEPEDESAGEKVVERETSSANESETSENEAGTANVPGSGVENNVAETAVGTTRFIASQDAPKARYSDATIQREFRPRNSNQFADLTSVSDVADETDEGAEAAFESASIAAPQTIPTPAPATGAIAEDVEPDASNVTVAETPAKTFNYQSPFVLKKPKTTTRESKRR